MAEIRYHEKLNKLKAGQVCSDCGTYYFFDEDSEIEHSGICRKCMANHEQLDAEEMPIDDVQDFREEIRELQGLERRDYE